MHARTNFALAVAATVAGTEAFMPAPVLSRGAVAPARAAVAPLRSGLAARKAVRGTGAVGLKANAHGKVKAEYIWIGGRGGCGDFPVLFFAPVRRARPCAVRSASAGPQHVWTHC